MLKFKKLGTDVEKIREYLEKSKISFCDISVGTKYMWRDEFVIEYAIYNDTLIMRESCPDYKDYFYYPMGSDIYGALSEIESHCKEGGEKLNFCCLDDMTVATLMSRYTLSEKGANRDWSDYIYNVQDFKGYAGKKFSGQRNHVNKFRKTYPDYQFKELAKEDFARVDEFLSEYEREITISVWTEQEEENKVRDYIYNMFNLSQVGGYIEINGKMVALSVGEVVGDTLIAHVEKGLKEYVGVYPTMAMEFAKHFATDGVLYINREEDCGDLGLRTSKTQYHPILIKDKCTLKVKTPFDMIVCPKITTQRLIIEDFIDTDKESYARLYLDDDVNKYYGYDYREDLGENKPTADYFYNFMHELKDKREEYSLAVRMDGNLIGEVVLYNFDFFGGVEIGARFFREYQGQGYGYEALSALIDTAKAKFGATKIKARAYKVNINSLKMINKLGFIKTSENEKMEFFEKV